MKRYPLIAILALSLTGLMACDKEEQQPAQYPQQPYPQQPYPQQPYPQQPYPQQQQPYPQPYPQPAQTAPMPAPSAPAQDAPTAFPGVMKRANGTCYFTPPSLDGNPTQPVDVMCPPGS